MSGELPYSYTFDDHSGDYMEIKSTDDIGGQYAVVTAHEVWVKPERLPEVVAALHKAAGLPEPPTLERPAIIPGKGEGNAFGLGDVHVYSTGNGVGVAVGSTGDSLSPPEARRMASVLVARADEAEAAANEPDPAEVEELALVLRKYTPGMAIPGDGDYGLRVTRGYADAALRWMRDREDTHGC